MKSAMLDILAATEAYLATLPPGFTIDNFYHDEKGNFTVRFLVDDYEQMRHTLGRFTNVYNGHHADALLHTCEASIESGSHHQGVTFSAHEYYEAKIFRGTWPHQQTLITPLGVQVWCGGIQRHYPAQEGQECEFRVHPDHLDAFHAWAHDQQIILNTPQDLSNTPN
jgi:hypothetical protein